MFAWRGRSTGIAGEESPYKVVLSVSFATRTTAVRDEDGDDDKEENEELSPAKTVVSLIPSFCKYHQSGYWLSAETGSDKDKDGGDDKEENEELSPAKTVVTAHKNTTFHRASLIICGIKILLQNRFRQRRRWWQLRGGK